eukprot:jgi/Botrbrau1/13530/Bobra.0347s0014.1
MLALDDQLVAVPGLPVAATRAPPQTKSVKGHSRTNRGKDPERFYCPYPSCNRSFAELWRLKVHYRAPPDVRGSGKERGHGCELQYCPKCGKELRAGKHHVGCFAGRTAPRQAAKRFKVPGEHISLEGNDEALSDDEVEGEQRGRAGMRPAAQEASEGSEASHPKDFDRKRAFSTMYGRREDSPDLVHGLNHARFSPNSHRILGGPGDPMLLPMGDFVGVRQSPNHSGERSVSGAGHRDSVLNQPRPPSPPPLPPGDDGRPTHFLFDFGLFDPGQDRCTSSRPHRPKSRDDGNRPVHTVLSNASSGEAGTYPAPMSDDYIMQIMFGAADVNSVPKRVTSHLHHWDEDVGDVDQFGTLAGTLGQGVADVVDTNPSSMRGALDTLVNYGTNGGPDPETVFLHRIVPLKLFGQPLISQRVAAVQNNFSHQIPWYPGGSFGMHVNGQPQSEGQQVPVVEAGKSGSLGTRDGDLLAGALCQPQYPPASVAPHMFPPVSMPGFIPSPPGPVFQQGIPMPMYPQVSASRHHGGWPNPALNQRAQA